MINLISSNVTKCYSFKTDIFASTKQVHVTYFNEANSYFKLNIQI